MRLFATLALAVLLAPLSACRAATIDVDTVIEPGSPLNGEAITVVDGLGGPTSVQIAVGASVAGFTLMEQSHLELGAGGFSTAPGVLQDDSSLLVTGGTIECTEPECRLTDYVAYLAARDRAAITITSGVVEHFIWLLDQSTLTVVGEELAVSGVNGEWQVSGKYHTGESVSLSVRNSSGVLSRIFLVPECESLVMAAALLMGLSAAIAPRSLEAL